MRYLKSERLHERSGFEDEVFVYVALMFFRTQMMRPSTATNSPHTRSTLVQGMNVRSSRRSDGRLTVIA